MLECGMGLYVDKVPLGDIVLMAKLLVVTEIPKENFLFCIRVI
jgi:hypothetical protein